MYSTGFHFHQAISLSYLHCQTMYWKQHWNNFFLSAQESWCFGPQPTYASRMCLHIAGAHGLTILTDKPRDYMSSYEKEPISRK